MDKLTVADVRYKMNQGGSYWWSKESMRFFNTRVESTLMQGDYFITSELSPYGHKRMYSVRHYDRANNDIDTVGDFYSYHSREQAKDCVKKLQKLAKELEVIINGDN